MTNKGHERRVKEGDRRKHHEFNVRVLNDVKINPAPIV